MTIHRTKADLAREMLFRARAITPPEPHTEWTNHEVKDLQLMLAEGKTFSCIAQRLGRSRNAVAGKVKRLRDAAQ